MTINKISRSGTSVVTLAELQSGSAIFVQKASRVTTAGPVITGGLVSRADIIKRGVQVQTIVGRALANPYGSVFNFFDRLGLSDEAILLLARQVALADQFFITHNTPQFLLNKGLSDSEPILERIALRISAFRVFEDAQFVSTTTKFTLNRPLADSQSLIDFTKIAAGYQRAAADIQSIVDTRLAITIGKTNQDTVTQIDSNAKRITALKQDQTIATEAKALTVGKGLFDGVTVRNHDDPGPALFVTKLLRDATTILDLTGVFDGLTYQNIMYRFETIAVSDNFARTITANRKFNDAQSIAENIYLLRGFNYQDTATPVDSKQLAITVQRSDATVVTEALQRAFLAQRVFQDTEIIAEVKALTTGLGKTDVAAMLERLVNAVSKANTDTAIVTENIIGKSSIKGLTDSIISSEAIAKLINKGLADEVTIIEDILILLINFIRINADSVNTVNAQPIFSVGKRLTDTTVNLEQNFKLIGKAAEDNFSTIDNRPVFAVSKYLADIASMSDLAAAFDGITYNYGLGRLDAAQATDEFIRQFTAFRTLEEQVSITDVLTKARGIGFAARTDTATVTDTIIRGTLKFETLFIGSGQDQRSRTEERIRYTITKRIDTNYITQIDNVNFFAGVQENFVGIVAGQTFAGSIMFASTSAGASVQVTSTGTGIGLNGGFATVYGNPYISFNGAGNRTVATVPIDFTAITSVSITFAYIAGNNSNGGEQPDLNEDLIIEYSIDDSATFVTAATIAAISTYGSPGWSQYTSSLPTAAKTSSTILRWRQTKQSISTGDNWGITNIQLGGTSFGTFVRTYYDNNTASIIDRLILGRFQTVGPDFVSFWRPPFEISSNLIYTQTNVEHISNLGPQTGFKNVVQSQYSGRWIVSDFNNAIYYSSLNGINWVRQDKATAFGGHWLGIDTTGVALVSVIDTRALPAAGNEYSPDGGQTWIKNVTSEAITSSLGTFYPMYRPDASYPSFVYPLLTSSSNGVCVYLYSSGTATSVVGERWSIGAAFPGIFQGGVNGTSNTLEIRGAANGSGTTVVYLTNHFNFGALYTLTDAATLGTAFTLTTSLSANRALFGVSQILSGAQMNSNQLAFGNGRFVWISQNGNLLTTTSPTVSASWQNFNLEAATTSYTTGGTTYGSFVRTPTNTGIHNTIVYDQADNRFIIANFTTSFAKAGFWTSNTGAPGSWSFTNVTSLGITAEQSVTGYSSFWANAVLNVHTGTIPLFTTGTTSISQFTVSKEGIWGSQRVLPLYYGSFDTFYEAQNPLPPDRVAFDVGISAKQGTSLTVSGQTTTARDSNNFYVGSQLLSILGSSSFVGVTSTLVSSTLVILPGNMTPWSENFETSFYTKSSISVIPDQALAPDGTYTADKIVTTSPNVSYIRFSTAGYWMVGQSYSISFHARVDEYSSSIGKKISTDHFDNANGYAGNQMSTSFTLTQHWQRFTTAMLQGSTAVTSRFSIYFSNGGVVSVPTADQLPTNGVVYIWGIQFTSANTVNGRATPTYAGSVGYTRTTSAPIVGTGVTQTINEYTTSNLYSSSIGWRYPLYYVGTEVSSYTLTGNTGNMLTWSENFSTAINTVVDSAITNDADVAPDGTTTADKMVLTGANGVIERPINGLWRQPGTQYTMRVYVKGDGSSVGRSVILYDYDAGNRTGLASITLTADWQVLTTTYFPNNNTTSFNWPVLQPGAAWYLTNSNPLSIGQSVYLWGWQYTTSSFVAGYTRTTSTALAGASSSVPFTIYTTAVGAYAFQPLIRSRDDNFEKVSFRIGQNPRENLTAAETTRFLITSSRRFNESAAIADNDALNVSLTVYRGVAGQVQLKTINAAGNGAQSSVLFSYGARSPDVVGTIDLIFVAIIKTAGFADTISIGSGIDQRQSTTERISFAITKPLADIISVDDRPFKAFTKPTRDTTLVTDRSTLNIGISKTDAVTTADVLTTSRGKGLTEIITVTDNIAQRISLLKTDAQIIADSRIFDVAVSKVDNITQQSLISLTAIKSVNDTVLEDDQSVKLIGLNKVDVLNTADQNRFDVALTAYRGVAGTVTLNTIDPSPDVEFEQSSVTVVRGARSPDEVGMLDLFSLFYVINRQIEDAIAAADDRTFFTITKTFADSFVPDDFLTTFDGLTYAGFMLRQDQVTADQRVFLDVVLGTRSDSIATLERILLTQVKTTADSVVNTDVTRNSISLLKTEIQYIAENRSLTVGKLLADIQLSADQASLISSYIRSLADNQNIDELKALSIGKYNADDLTAFDLLTLLYVSNKFQFDAIFNEDAAQFAIGKFTNNTVTGSDILAFNQGKTLSDSFEENDAVSQTLSLVKTDDQLLADRSNLSLTLLRSDSASLDDVASLIGAFNRFAVDDLFVTQEPVFFTITKQLSDSFVPDDFLQTFDGLTYAYATSRYDEIINSQRVYLDMVLGARTDTVVSLEQILVAQLKQYDDSVVEADQLQLRIDNLINNIAIAADVQTFSVAAIKADFIAGDERKYLDIAKSAAADTISLADLIDLILFIPTPNQFYFDTIFISDATAFNFDKDLSGLPVTVAVDVAIKFDVAIVAHRGVAGTVTLNTIDPSPDVEFEQSSVTVSRSSADNDEVGMLDFFSLTYATVRTVTDSIASTDVAPKFAITKLLRDSAVPDDFLQTFDGLTYATTILKQDVISIGLPGFTGPRVSGDNRERIAIDVATSRTDAVSSIDTRLTIITGKGNSDAVQNSDALALRVSILKTDVQIVADTQRFFNITTSRSDSIINQDALRRDISKLLGSTEIISITDLLALALQYRLSLSDIQSILAEKDGHFSYLLAQTLRNDDLSVDDDRLASFISKDLTNLDGLNNINTMVSNGTLRMTDYADIDYFAEDYVGQSRSFT